jgi:hypothetical protein
MFSGYVKMIFVFVNAKIEVNFQFMECHDLSSLCDPPSRLATGRWSTQ